ncbi:MAG: NAD(+) synthase [Ruminococcaceae bacterium]|nr:NAD(+) synthase [Oscillospiraceae bacterium]
MKDGFVKVAALSPIGMRPADCLHNASVCATAVSVAAEKGAVLALLPELCLTGYTCGDLFLNRKLVDSALEALRIYLALTADCGTISVVGLPVAHAGKIYNCAAVCFGGMLLGLVPKCHIPNHTDEGRYFAPAPQHNLAYEFDGCFLQLGTKQIFVCPAVPDFTFAVVLGGDLTLPVSPTVGACSAGATVVCHPTATPVLVRQAEKRRRTVADLSDRLLCACISVDAGSGESSTDYVFGGHSLIAEKGTVLAEVLPFAGESCTTEIDVQMLSQERRRLNTFDNTQTGDYTEVYIDLMPTETVLTRTYDPHPFLPSKDAEGDARCELILNIQAQGLARRLTAAYANKAVIGISGGSDSCLALLVMARAMDILERPRTDILAVTMPCFGTTARTRGNAEAMCEALGTNFRCVDILASVTQHLKDIGHDIDNHNVVYENAQARERTQILMDIANEVNGLVVGTGDLSELALGWATYNGDHMSMYSVNGDLPKTLVKHLIDYCARKAAETGDNALAAPLFDILDTPISPELLPAKADGEIAQVTEDLVGPYELHDFYLYHFLRYGYTPTKMFRLAKHALGDVYDDATLFKWLETLLRRFFNQQFKRSCLPDGPEVGSVGLSPRGDWKMPSDAVAALWLEEVRQLKENF